MFSQQEESECRRLVVWALNEDLGVAGDLTSGLVSTTLPGQADLAAREPGVLAGSQAVNLVCEAVDPGLKITWRMHDGEPFAQRDVLGSIAGPAPSLLIAERTALNFLQYLSGVATRTSQFVQAIAGLPAKILDTRKTLPAYRLLAKYAVRMGGGQNHRMGLFDMVLIKDNHLAALGEKRSLAEWVAIARSKQPGVPIEVEVDRLEQFDAVLSAEPDMILLDNMAPALMSEAVARRNAKAPRVLLEASGGVTLETVRAIAETGVDRISVGGLTHSVRALDIGLDYRV